MAKHNSDILLPPSAKALLESLRGMGYTLSTSVADIIDNSISAKATTVYIDTLQDRDGSNGKIVIADDGEGMTRQELIKAMALGAISPRETREVSDLGRFGLGLKTASFSQCRRLTVVSRKDGELSSFTWDLDYLQNSDEWKLRDNADLPEESIMARLGEHGTLVIWERLDRVPAMAPGATTVQWTNTFVPLRQHLQLTFHRFLEDKLLKIYFNNKAIKGWDPFFSNDPGKPRDFPEVYWPITSKHPSVTMQCYVLPEKEAAKQELFGPEDALNLQGFFIYRGRRLICTGGWLGLPGFKASECFRFARIRIDFENQSDTEWKIDIRKSTATPPQDIRDWLIKYAAQVRTISENLYVGSGEQKRVTSERSTLWSKARRGEPVLVNVTDPFIQTLYEQVKSGKLTPELLSGYLELLALSHPTEVKKSMFQTVSPEARKAFSVAHAQMVKTFGKEMADSILKYQKPFADWDFVSELLGE